MKVSKLFGKTLLIAGGFIFFMGFKVVNYNLYFLIVGAVMSGLGLYIMYLIDEKEEHQTYSEFNTWKNDLILNGDVIDVPLDQCEIKSNNYREEVIPI